MGEWKIGRMVLGVCQTNCYFVYRTGSSKVIVIDPADCGAQIAAALERNGFMVAGILLTHGHFDHILGCKELKQAAQAKADEQGAGLVYVYASEAEKELLHNPSKNLSHSMAEDYMLDADIYGKDGEEYTIADMTFRMIETPGHTEGGCCYYFEQAGMLLCGDTLFLESVGRTDFPTGSMSTLVRSVQDKLFVLPEDTIVYPGHGDSTTIGHEKQYNPFCSVKD